MQKKEQRKTQISYDFLDFPMISYDYPRAIPRAERQGRICGCLKEPGERWIRQQTHTPEAPSNPTYALHMDDAACCTKLHDEYL